MPRTTNVNHVQIVLFDHASEVRIDKVQPGSGSPVTQQPGFDVFEFQRLFEERIIVEVNLSHRQVVGRTPVSIHYLQFAYREDIGHSVAPIG